MKIERFTEVMKNLIENKLGSDYRIQEQRVTKNNETTLIGLSVNKHGENINPVIYMEAYYERYLTGKPLELVVEDVMEEYGHFKDEGVPADIVDRFHEWSQIKDKVLFKLVNAEQNKTLLKELPHRLYMDLAIIYYMYLGESAYGQYTARITDAHMHLWNVTEEDLYNMACKNTPVILPAIIRSIEDIMGAMIRECLGESGREELSDDYNPQVPHQALFHVITNEFGMNGAACILYKGCLAQFAKEQGGDIVILPSSLHEALLIPDREGLDYQQLRAMVADVNENEVPAGEVLSGQIYRYLRAEDQIELAG